MNTITKIFGLFSLALILFSSCEEVLDKKPLDIISETDVWKDPALIQSYLARQYYATSVFTLDISFTSKDDNNKSDQYYGVGTVTTVSDEAAAMWLDDGGRGYKNGLLKINGGLMEWWEKSYAIIRNLNELLEKVPASIVLDANQKKQFLAEARFLRAFNYFAMVKRYGGVPLITKLENIDNYVFPTRNKEQEVYDFILSEVELIKNDLPETSDASYHGRPTKYAAIALGCRAALYAGSIAQYGTVALNGVVGISASEKDKYYKKAYKAAQEIIASNKYILYNSNPDKVMNFREVFTKDNNSEVIFAKVYDATIVGSGWAWDFIQCPKPHAWNAGMHNTSYWELIQEFEKIDGTPGTMTQAQVETPLWTTEELFKNKDPRFFASVYTLNSMWKGSKIDFHNGIYKADGTFTTSDVSPFAAKGIQNINGRYGGGFAIMKYLDETRDNLQANTNNSGTDFKVFRYGEILLNLAEAGFELNKTDSALWAVNQIRNRAGIAPLTSVTRDKIRKERRVELAFEGHRYWDVRRWRIAVTALTGKKNGLQYYLDYNSALANKADPTQPLKYKIKIVNGEIGSSLPAFREENYYLPITTNRTSNNTNLVENPGY